jgi:hypothetical protein
MCPTAVGAGREGAVVAAGKVYYDARPEPEDLGYS